MFCWSAASFKIAIVRCCLGTFKYFYLSFPTCNKSLCLHHKSEEAFMRTLKYIRFFKIEVTSGNSLPLSKYSCLPDELMPRVQNNFILLCRSSGWYAGSSCQLQHHCQGVEAFIQHASRRKWNLGKLWSEGRVFNISTLIITVEQIVPGEPCIWTGNDNCFLLKPFSKSFQYNFLNSYHTVHWLKVFY